MTPLSLQVKLTYRRCLEQPILILLVMSVLCVAAAMQLPKLSFDASSDTLIAQGDPELAFYNEVVATFGDRPFLVLTYSPRNHDLFTKSQVDMLQRITGELKSIASVESVQSLLDAPLLKSPPVPLTELQNGYRTVASPDVDLLLAREELIDSPLFRELLISVDGQTTAIRVNLRPDEELARLIALRDAYPGEVDPDIERAYQLRAQQAKVRVQQTIDEVRALRDRYSQDALMYLGGIPMVTADMIKIIREDMLVFGLVVVGLLITALYSFFRRLRWVLFPLGASAVTILLMLGALSVLRIPITAVSANFVALIAIITISFTVHLIQRYRELHDDLKDDPKQCALAFETMRSKLAPCLYTGLTTSVAFASLVTADIVPVVDFGIIMCVGVLISLLVTYSFFASALVLLPKNESVSQNHKQPALTRWMAALATRQAVLVVLISAIMLVVAVIGISKLSVGNRLVEYFRADTEIRQGLNYIDQRLGGTIPLEVIVQLDPFEPIVSTIGENDFDEFDDFGSDDIDVFPERYWFSPEKIALIEKLHTFLDQQPGIGKTISVSNLEKLARDYNEGNPLSYLQLTAALAGVPEAARSGFIEPYASPRSGQMRISSRLHETGPELDLDALIHSIEAFAVDQLDIAPEDIRVTGVAVLFSDMLEQLVDSQLSTLGFVLTATLFMFALLLRSWRLAVVGLLPNVLAALLILAFMGYLGIPLDLMTITITAIVIGIGVDDAIHYLHRYQEERDLGYSAVDSVLTTHASIGAAIYFTSFTVIAGFAVLLFSRFVPTIYFGALAALAMLLALTANLTLLPALLIKMDFQQ